MMLATDRNLGIGDEKVMVAYGKCKYRKSQGRSHNEEPTDAKTDLSDIDLRDPF
jgi:hypothetical protein